MFTLLQLMFQLCTIYLVSKGYFRIEYHALKVHSDQSDYRYTVHTALHVFTNFIRMTIVQKGHEGDSFHYA